MRNAKGDDRPPKPARKNDDEVRTRIEKLSIADIAFDDLDFGNDEVHDAEPGDERLAEPPERAWTSDRRVTSTEVALRFALHMLKEWPVTNNIVARLTGSELKPNGKRKAFPVIDFLAAQGCPRRPPLNDDWHGVYRGKESKHSLILVDEVGDAPMIVELRGEMRLLVVPMGGPSQSTHSNLEHTALRTAIGRAVTLDTVRRRDVIVVALPRSPRHRALCKEWRSAPRLIRAGIRLAMVNRAGFVDGLSEIGGRSG